MAKANYVLTLSCVNRPGIVAAVSTYLFEHGGDIREAQQFDDPETGKFSPASPSISPAAPSLAKSAAASLPLPSVSSWTGN